MRRWNWRIADYITIEQTAVGPRAKLFHCKASAGSIPGNRVEDLYDVCGQAVKSCIWTRPEQLLEQLKHRSTLQSTRKYVKGGEADAIRLLSLAARQQVQFEIHVVQPGVMRDDREGALSNLLAATRDYLLDGGVDIFGVIGS